MADENKDEKKTFAESKVTMINRNNLAITGVERVVSSTSSLVNLKVTGTPMCVEGTNLSVAKLDVDQGVIVLEGTVNSIHYGQGKKAPIFKRIFK